MPVTHSYQSATPNNPAHEISSTRWNDDHTVSIVNADVAAGAGIVESKLSLSFATHAPVTLGTANGLSLLGQALSMTLSATGTSGALSAVDYSRIAFKNEVNIFTANQNITKHAAIGADASLTNPGQLMFPGVPSRAILDVEETFTGSASGVDITSGVISHVMADPSTNAVAFYGANIAVDTKPGNTKDFVYVIGLYGASFHESDGNITGYMSGLEYYAAIYGGGDVAGAYGINSGVNHYGSGAIIDMVGLYVYTFRDGSAGAVTNNYGIKIPNISGATTINDAIHTGLGRVYFGDIVNTTESYYVDSVKVVGNRVVDARCDDAINSGDATTDGVIDALRDAMITHGLIAAA